MPARRRREFLPGLHGLEDRTLFSRGLRHAPAVMAAASVPAPQGEPGTGLTGAADWLQIHEADVARARRGGDAVVFLGDSMIAFWGDPRRKALPGMLGPLGLTSWDASFAPLRAANFGVIGDRTENVLWRVGNGELSGRPRVAVVLVGINDLASGRTPAQTAAGVASVVSAVRTVSPTTRVLLLGLLPGVSDPGAPLRVQARQVNALIAGLATSDGSVTFLDAGTALLNPDGTLAPGLVQDTTVHPTDRGYAALAAVVRPAVSRLLAEPLRAHR